MPEHAFHTQNGGFLVKDKGFRICCCPGESKPCYYHADSCEETETDCPEGEDNVYVFCEQAPDGDEIFAFEGACYVVDDSVEYDALPDGGVVAPIIATFASCLECCGVDGTYGCTACWGNGNICDTSADEPISLYLTINSLVTDYGDGDSWTGELITLLPVLGPPCIWYKDLEIWGNDSNYMIEYIRVICTNSGVGSDYWIHVHISPGYGFGADIYVLHEDYSPTPPYNARECPFGHYDYPGGHVVSASADIV